MRLLRNVLGDLSVQRPWVHIVIPTSNALLLLSLLLLLMQLLLQDSSTYSEVGNDIGEHVSSLTILLTTGHTTTPWNSNNTPEY